MFCILLLTLHKLQLRILHNPVRFHGKFDALLFAILVAIAGGELLCGDDRHTNQHRKAAAHEALSGDGEGAAEWPTLSVTAMADQHCGIGVGDDEGEHVLRGEVVFLGSGLDATLFYTSGGAPHLCMCVHRVDVCRNGVC